MLWNTFTYRDNMSCCVLQRMNSPPSLSSFIISSRCSVFLCVSVLRVLLWVARMGLGILVIKSVIPKRKSVKWFGKSFAFSVYRESVRDWENPSSHFAFFLSPFILFSSSRSIIRNWLSDSPSTPSCSWSRSQFLFFSLSSRLPKKKKSEGTSHLIQSISFWETWLTKAERERECKTHCREQHDKQRMIYKGKQISLHIRHPLSSPLTVSNVCTRIHFRFHSVLLMHFVSNVSISPSSIQKAKRPAELRMMHRRKPRANVNEKKYIGWEKRESFWCIIKLRDVYQTLGTHGLTDWNSCRLNYMLSACESRVHHVTYTDWRTTGPGVFSPVSLSPFTSAQFDYLNVKSNFSLSSSDGIKNWLHALQSMHCCSFSSRWRKRQEKSIENATNQSALSVSLRSPSVLLYDFLSFSFQSIRNRESRRVQIDTDLQVKANESEEKRKPFTCIKFRLFLCHTYSTQSLSPVSNHSTHSIPSVRSEIRCADPGICITYQSV